MNRKWVQVKMWGEVEKWERMGCPVKLQIGQYDWKLQFSGGEQQVEIKLQKWGSGQLNKAF